MCGWLSLDVAFSIFIFTELHFICFLLYGWGEGYGWGWRRHDTTKYTDKQAMRKCGQMLPEVLFVTVEYHGVMIDTYNYQKTLLVDSKSETMTVLIKQIMKIRQELIEKEAEQKPKPATDHNNNKTLNTYVVHPRAFGNPNLMGVRYWKRRTFENERGDN